MIGTAELGAMCSAVGPFDLRLEPIARFLNCELVDDPVYDGLELQYFDDPLHGTGLLAFLSRRADRRVDYYLQHGLRLDPAGFTVGAGLRSWNTDTHFEAARLEVARDGVVADVRFTDVDGRLVEVRVDDCDGRPRRRAELLAPVSSGIDRPTVLLLVYLHSFDLVRAHAREAVVRIAGREASTGTLPGARLHRRRLIEYAAPLCAVQFNTAHDGPIGSGEVPAPAPDRRRTVVTARHGTHHARFTLVPALPDLATIPDGSGSRGTWGIEVDGARLTGGGWSARRRGAHVDLALDVEERWRPGRLPLLMRLVTRLVPTFRRWPTTYRWRARVTLGDQPTMTSAWQRTGEERGNAYRRATGS